MGSLLGSREQFLFDSISQEVMRLAGVDHCILWKFFGNKPGQKEVDQLYEEPKEGTLHYEPYKVLGFFQEPTQVQDATETGRTDITDGKFYFARRDLEDRNIPRDDNGDRIQVGDIVQIARAGRPRFFEIKNREETGWMNDSQVFTHYVCDVVRSEDFTPERKIYGRG